MIKLEADCDNCVHVGVCSFSYNAKDDMEKLKYTRYSENPNTDYSWDFMTKHRNVDITFSCPNFQANIIKKDLVLKEETND